MYQRAPLYIETLVPAPFNKTNARSLTLGASTAASLGAALADDARGALFSGISTLADALWGVQRGHFSWATVKFYYACFYAAKAALARDGLAVFYVGSSPALLEATAGSQISFCGGNSHAVVTSEYERRFPFGALVSQEIDAEPAFRWITRRREEVNYRLQKFSDPVPNEWFKKIVDLGVRKAMPAYLNDPTLYAYDSDHAICVLPLLAFLEERKKTVPFAAFGLTSDQIAYLKPRFADDKGVLSSITAALFD
jgi:hypothetical protein